MPNVCNSVEPILWSGQLNWHIDMLDFYDSIRIAWVIILYENIFQLTAQPMKQH